MKHIPTIEENPNGLHQKYLIKKIIRIKPGRLDYGDRNGGNRSKPTLITKDIDPNAEYFVLRLDSACKDKNHLKACTEAIHAYADAIWTHLPELAEDLRKRYPLF